MSEVALAAGVPLLRPEKVGTPEVVDEIRSFTPVLDQARAESSLRMLEAANAKGAVGVVNVRFEAVRINNNASELLSYGTLVY